MKTKTTFFSFLPVLLILNHLATAPNTPHTANAKYCACEIYVPNVFTPNGDTKNDVFKAFSATSCSFSTFNLKVFDRFGNLIFESSSIDQGWDGDFKGQDAPSATYVYLIQYELADDDQKQPKMSTGEVILLR